VHRISGWPAMASWDVCEVVCETCQCVVLDAAFTRVFELITHSHAPDSCLDAS
jgi:hypothetical protein